jgi:hypothetical protein
MYNLLTILSRIELSSLVKVEHHLDENGTLPSSSSSSSWECNVDIIGSAELLAKVSFITHPDDFGIPIDGGQRVNRSFGSEVGHIEWLLKCVGQTI